MTVLVTVLLTILKVLGILLLAVLLLLLTALLIPVGGQIIFEGGKLRVKAKAGPVSLTVFPWPFGKKKGKPGTGTPKKKPKKKKSPKAQPPKPPAVSQPAPEQTGTEIKQEPASVPEKAEPEKKAEPKPQTPVYAKKEKKKPAPKAGGGKQGGLGGLPWEKIISALELLPEVLKKLFGSIRIYDIRLTVPVHKQDAAATAVAYGRVNGLIGGALAAASHIFQVEIYELNVLCDYTGDEAGKERFSCKITTHLFQMVILGVTTLIELKKRKII